MEELNRTLFMMINATPASPSWLISLATFIARDVISIVPLLIIALWLWGPRDQVDAQRRLVVKTALALIISLAISWGLGLVFPHDRPFVVGLGYNFLHHAADDSYPSNHGTIIFTFALAFMFWHRIWSGLLLSGIALAIAWSRVYLGVHWPFDMLGAFLVALCACLISQLIWKRWGHTLHHRLSHLYRLCFAMPIRKGWVRD